MNDILRFYEEDPDLSQYDLILWLSALCIASLKLSPAFQDDEVVHGKKKACIRCGRSLQSVRRSAQLYTYQICPGKKLFAHG